MADNLLQCKDISKSFGPTKALKSVSFSLHSGEIHGLVGENGSGKSTLSSIIAGVQPPDSGTMTLRGETYEPDSMLYANQKGIAIIVQERGTIPGISVAMNIFLGLEERFSKNGVFHYRKMVQAAQDLIDSLGMEGIDASSDTSLLNAENRKLVEIARAVYFDPDILIVDETTTALSQTGRDIIYRIIKKMSTEGKGVIFISHDLDELMQVCNCVTVLRDGVYIETFSKDTMNIPEIREKMVGRQLEDNYYRADRDGSYSEKVVLKLERVSSNELIENFDLELHEGEILGLAGLSECGMHEIGRIASGIDKTITGRVFMPETGCNIKNIRIAVKQKISYISKNRDTEALILSSSVKDNILLPSYGLIEKGPFITSKNETRFAETEAEKLSIKCSSVNQITDDLSGGNKQKVVFAKWQGNQSSIYIMDCPTRGIDVGVKMAMYSLMYRLKKEGKSILLISEELTELIGMSDRILVIKNGKVTKEFQRENLPEEKEVIRYMI